MFINNLEIITNQPGASYTVRLHPDGTPVTVSTGATEDLLRAISMARHPVLFAHPKKPNPQKIELTLDGNLLQVTIEGKSHYALGNYPPELLQKRETADSVYPHALKIIREHLLEEKHSYRDFVFSAHSLWGKKKVSQDGYTQMLYGETPLWLKKNNKGHVEVWLGNTSDVHLIFAEEGFLTPTEIHNFLQKIEKQAQAEERVEEASESLKAEARSKGISF